VSEPAGFTPLSLADLFGLDLPEPAYAVDGILPLGSATLLDAREKSGKGLLTIDLCASVALGEPFVDRAVMEGPSIYCAAEEHLRDVRHRIGQRVGTERDAPFYVLPLNGSTPDRLSLHDPVTLQSLYDMGKTYQPIVLIIDTLREVHEGKEDSSDDMAPLLRPLRQLAHDLNVALVVNHHQNRAGTFRGSTAIRAAFDQEWSFTRTDDDHAPAGEMRGTLRIEGRYGPRQSIAILLGEGLRWRPATPTVSVGESGLRERILATIDDTQDWLSTDDLHARLGGAKKTIQNELSRMVKEQPPPFAFDGRGVRGCGRRYHTLQPRLHEDDGAGRNVPADDSPLRERDERNNPNGRKDGADATAEATSTIPPDASPLRARDERNNRRGRSATDPKASGKIGTNGRDESAATADAMAEDFEDAGVVI
jgi:AAA domain